MILKYLDPESEYSAQERVLNTIYIGAVRRDQLLRLLSNCLKHARIDQVLQALRRKGWLSTIYAPGKGAAIYFLSGRGLRQIGEDGTKTARHRVAYHIAVNDVLIRCISQFGLHGWEWHESPNDNVARRPMPSAMIHMGSETWWIDVDDGLRLSRQMYGTCQRYKRFLRDSSRSERVLFVAPNEQRERYLRNRVAGFSGSSVRFYVCNAEQVATYLEGSTVSIS